VLGQKQDIYMLVTLTKSVLVFSMLKQKPHALK